MAVQSDGPASQIVREVAECARSVSSRMDGREPRELLLDDVRSFARRKPGTFLLGALAAGVVAGRLTRGAKEARSASGGSSSGPYGAASTGWTYGLPCSEDTETGLPNLGGSVSSGATWSDTGARGDRS